MVIVQIYEVTSAAEARTLVAAGVDHIGVLVGKGQFPREQAFAAARAIFAAVPPPARKVALSLAESVAEVGEVIAETLPDIVHIGTWPEALPLDEVKKLKAAFPAVKIMRTIPVRNEGDVALARSYQGVADFLLLDTWKAAEPSIGATGCVHDWSLSREIADTSGVPVILAGGIGPENAEQAMRRVQPAGLDSKTRTDNANGSAKDLDKVRSMVEAIRRYEQTSAASRA